jgi:hypothetical protein
LQSSLRLLIGVLENGEEPFILDRKFALTIGKGAGLADCLGGLTGTVIEVDELDLEEYLGTVGMINIKHEQDGDYTNAVHTSYAPLSKSDAKRKFKPVGEYKILDLDNFDQEVFDSLPDWKQKKIAATDEYKALVASKMAKAVSADNKQNQSSTKANAPAAKAEPAKASAKPGKAAPAKPTAAIAKGSKAGKLFK